MNAPTPRFAPPKQLTNAWFQWWRFSLVFFTVVFLDYVAVSQPDAGSPCGLAAAPVVFIAITLWALRSEGRRRLLHRRLHDAAED